MNVRVLDRALLARQHLLERPRPGSPARAAGPVAAGQRRFARLTAGKRAEIETEAGRLPEFLAAGERAVRFTES